MTTAIHLAMIHCDARMWVWPHPEMSTELALEKELFSACEDGDVDIVRRAITGNSETNEVLRVRACANI